MSSHSLPTIEIDCRLPPALRLAACVGCAVGATVPLLVLPVAVAGAALSTVLAGFFAAAFRHAGWFGGPRALRRATWSADGRWWLEDGQGICGARLRADTRVFARWLWLSWSSSAGARHALILRSGGDAPAARQLAARLRLTGVAPAANPEPVRL